MKLNKITSDTLLVTASQAGLHLLLFARNLLIARLVSPADFALALTLALSASLVQMMTDVGLDRFVIQDPKGDDPDVLKTVHLANLGRGALISLLLFSASTLIADLFGVSDIYWAYQILAAILLIRAFDNLDTKRMQRHHRFGPDLTVNVVSQAAGLIAGVIAALQIGTFVAMLWAIAAQTICFTLLTHVLAERRYSCGLDRKHVDRLFVFGWPLVINGFVLFIGSQGDRVLVGSALSLEDLALYGAATTLTGALGVFVIRVIATISLPRLSELTDDDTEFATQLVALGVLVLGISVAANFAIGLTGKGFVELLFGVRYQLPMHLPIFLGLMVAFWIAQIWPTLVALSKGQTRQVLFVNIFRISGVLLAGLSIAAGGKLVLIAASIATGEALAFLFSYTLNHRHSKTMGAASARVAVAILGCNFLAATAVGLILPLGLLRAFTVTTLLITMIAGSFIFSRPDLRDKIRSFF